jgi:hypothetical protein
MSASFLDPAGSAIVVTQDKHGHEDAPKILGKQDDDMAMNL